MSTNNKAQRFFIIRFSLFSVLFGFVVSVFSSSSIAQYHRLTILVPADRGGGWDLTAKAMEESLKEVGAATEVEIEYSPGAGGLIGLAQFIASKRGKPDALLVGGSFTVGATVPHHSNVSLTDTTPIARLTWGEAVIAVPFNSSLNSIDDLFEVMLSNPEALSWVGGSKGGVDEAILIALARSLGVSVNRVHYTPLPGGGKVGEALSKHSFTVGISGYGELIELIHEKKLRVLAGTSKRTGSKYDAPSFQDIGINTNQINWRGVFAAPGIDEEQKQALVEVINRMVVSPTWKKHLDDHYWQDAFLKGDEFNSFLEMEQKSAHQYFKGLQDLGQSDELIASVVMRRYAWVLSLSVLCVVLVSLIYVQYYRARNREEGLQHAFEIATGEANLRVEELERALAGIQSQIQSEFERWGLSGAERDITILMLKGLRMKEIALSRGTSERTVRQQAQSVYRKAGISGRSDLAAYFIEDFMQSLEVESK